MKTLSTAVDFILQNEDRDLFFIEMRLTEMDFTSQEIQQALAMYSKTDDTEEEVIT